MGLITDLTPTNYSSERAKFFADPSFNPQFVYKRDFSKKELMKFGLPSNRYLKIAQEIVDKTLEGSSPKNIFENRGEVLEQSTVEEAILDFLKNHHLDARFKIIWSREFAGRASVNKNTIKLRLPCAVRRKDLMGLIYHELGTHALRRINYEKQPWFEKKRKFGFSSYLKTEEGLATIHTLLDKKEPMAYRSSINYLATHKAQTSSFLEVYEFMLEYFADQERAFSTTFKKKRGLEDTGEPGGFTKDLVYFEGFVDVINFLLTKNFPLEELYFGKMAMEDVIKAVEMNPTFKPTLPDFYTNDPEKYKSKILEIARVNGISI